MGETVKAVVVRVPGSMLTEAELVEFARPRLAGFKRPRSVDFVADLPRNPSGKPLERELRAPYWRAHDPSDRLSPTDRSPAPVGRDDSGSGAHSDQLAAE